MKRFICVIFALTVLISSISVTVNSVTYTDIRPTYTESLEISDYNGGDANDDDLRYRSNCYGYAIRMHYGPVDFPDSQYQYELDGNDYSWYESNYRQTPGEFYDEKGTGITYKDLRDGYRENGTHITKVLANLIRDSETLETNLALAFDTILPSSYIPPSADTDPSKRLCILVVNSNGRDFHFYMQHSDNSWSHKPGELAARTTCYEHPNAILTNSNIAQHVHCSGYDGEAVAFYITAYGSSDRSHTDGHSTTSYYTPVTSGAVPGDHVESAHVIGSISANKIFTGKLEYLYDEDYLVFDVATTGTYTFNLGKGSDYTLRIYTGIANNLSSLTGVTSYSATGTSYSFSKTLQAGTRYFIRVFELNPTEHDPSIYYSFIIQRNN